MVGVVRVVVVTAAITIGTLLTAAPAAVAQPARTAAAGKCSKVLNGYRPHAAATYLSTSDASTNLYLPDVKDGADGTISGPFDVDESLVGAAGTFAGTISHDTITVQATFGSSENNLGISSLSFTGTVTCLLSKISTESLVTSPAGLLPRSWTLTTVCPGEDSDEPSGQGIACIARQIRDGLRQPGPYTAAIPDGGAIPYVSGGGHALSPGPSKVKVKGKRKAGLDCSGFTRWVYDVAYGADVLYGRDKGTTRDQWKLTKHTDSSAVGDLVFFRTATGRVTHVGIDLGDGYMLDEPHTGAVLRVESISGFGRKDHERHSYGRYTLG